MIRKMKLDNLKTALKDLDYDEGIKITCTNSEKVFINKNILEQYVVQYLSTLNNEIRYYDKLEQVLENVKKRYKNNFYFMKY